MLFVHHAFFIDRIHVIYDILQADPHATHSQLLCYVFHIKHRIFNEICVPQGSPSRFLSESLARGFGTLKSTFAKCATGIVRSRRFVTFKLLDSVQCHSRLKTRYFSIFLNSESK